MDEINEYRKILESIEQVRKELGENSYALNFPQITVIGDQSSGKSSLLTEVSGIPFPTASGMTTKCPIIVYTKHNEKETKFSVERNKEKKETTRAEISNVILEIQATIAPGEKEVNSTPITLYAEGDEFEDLVLVDLPGIVWNSSKKDDVIEMIKKYISPNESLILVVTEAKQDEETAHALELAKTFDPNEERTIRVLTKYDMFDSEESKERANEIISQVSQLSPHAIVCRPNGNVYSDGEESYIFSSLSLPKERVGVLSLKKRLPKLLCNLIRTNLPGLKDQSHKVLADNIKKLQEIGEFAPDNTRIILDVQKDLLAKYSSLETQLSVPMDTFRENIHNTQSIITEEMINENYVHNAFVCIFFQGEETFNIILKKLIDQWKPILESLYSKVSEILTQLFNVSELKNIPGILKSTIDNSWQDCQRCLLGKFLLQINHELMKEIKFKTMNHYLTSKYQENMMVPKSVLDDIIGSITKSTYSVNDCRNMQKCLDTNVVQKNIRGIIEKKLEDYNKNFEQESIKNQHKMRLLAASQAYFAVAHKNLIDNIMDAVEQQVINETKSWVSLTLLEDRKIREYTFEDPKIERSRKEYKKIIETMERCIKILD